jgi:hypothetical protein
MSRSKRVVAAIVSGLILWPPLLAAQGTAAPAGDGAGKAQQSKTEETRSTAAKSPQVANLSAAQILEKHVAARGGVQAWRAVQTLQLNGKIDAGRGDSNARAMQMVNSSKKHSGKASADEVTPAPAEGQNDAKEVQLSFTLEVKRPNKSRLEIEVAGKTAVQVYDGVNGWKVRPFLNRNDAEPFTADEAKSEATRSDFDGPLIDAAAKGTKLALEGVEQIDGQPAYRLKATLKNGSVQHVWIDARTFLDIRVEGVPRRMDGKLRTVYVYQRDFRSVQGVMIPFLLETTVDGYPDRHKMVVEKAAVNPHLDDTLFSKPQA